MFPSSGLFADIICPFSKSGLCERPHCLYKHATEELRDMCAASYKSSIVDFAGRNGYPHAVCGAPANDDTKDGLQELERINKEIETVRHEVEQEQKRLSRYQTVQAGSTHTALNSSVSKSDITSKNMHRGSYGLSSSTNVTKTCSRARKYVVDNSKPRTDLEYDPLSNFSAGLRSYSSSGKEQKVKNGQGLKRARNAVSCDQKKPVTYQAQLSRSPEPLDDSNEDCVLIIDVPPSPDEKRLRAQKPVDSVPGKSLHDKVEVIKDAQTTNILLDTPPHLANSEVCKVSSTVEKNRVYSSCVAENNKGPSDLYENKGCENIPVYGHEDDITGCLEDLACESLKISNHFQAAETQVEESPEPASPAATTVQQDPNWNKLVVEKEKNKFQIELPLCELPHSVEKMNPVQPHHFSPKNSLFYKAPAANPDSPCRQHTKQTLTTEQPAQNRVSNQWSSTKCVPSVWPHSQETSSKMPGQMQGKTIPPESCLKLAEPASGSSQGQAWHNLSASSLMNRVESSTEQLLVKEEDTEDLIIIDSSSDDENELNYSEMELSDSDPMEECYRIFMEANSKDQGNEEQPDVSVGSTDVEKPELNSKPQASSGKKRVAHEARYTEPVAKSRPQPQVLVPLCGPAVSGFYSQPSTASKFQQVQQRASMLAASVKGGQAFVSSTCEKKPETQSAPSPAAQTLENVQPAPLQNAYINYVPLGTAVIEVGNNLHLILPEGAFPLPVTSSSSQVTSVLTPISQVHMSTVAVKQIYHPPSVTPLQRYRTTAPVLIPAPARKPSLTSAFALAHSNPAVSTTPQTPVHAAVKPVPTKRKLKQQCEATKDKVPHDIRQRYINMFTEEFLKTTANVNDAFEKALAEERTVYNRSVNKLKYLSVAVNALKKLKNQSGAAVKDENDVSSQRFKGNIPLNLKKFKGNDDMAFYESLKDYILTEEKLIESNYPVQHPEKSGCAVLFADNKKGNADPLKRICCRCGATYSVSQTGKHTRKEECNYHYGKGVKNKVPGGVETRYSCCEGVMGAPGCQVFKLHVHDSLSLDGFVSTVRRHPSDTSCPGVYSLDCEMCYTIHGLELSRVTVVNSSLQIIYDTFVRPDNEVIDLNTRFSGISEEDVKGNCTSLREVQETLLSFINADTILIGHGLETDLCALKFLHGTVVDTSVVFPHRLGPPHKLTLNNLTAEYLRRIIQESVCGHDTAEDAAACMELMLWKVKEDGKLKK
ncbi:RNA exonuclease 1 homolog isoform X2 [Micropterus dolomieu]|uniref:RNA exonuclease 1 homolog isoform X2 n=1 Tax=Micropterus dolomieu TaxID=147949 RepID=UPI001E8DEB0F|nr:RNA exonuclease 1 homolog isoform X2 [Micropterus dolomieu]